MTRDQHDELLAQVALLEATVQRLEPEIMTGAIDLVTARENNKRLYRTIALQLTALQGFVAGLRLAGYRKP